eukprot:g6233.t1
MHSTSVENIDLVHVRENLFRIGWERGAFSDVQVSAFGHDYSTHRIILCQSPYFARLLHHDDLSNVSRLIVCFDDPYIEAESFRGALEFLYGRSIAISESTFHGTLATGCVLGLDLLCEKCFEFISENLTMKSFTKIYTFAIQFDYGVYTKRIKELCLDFLKMHLCLEAREYLKTLEWVDLRELLMDDGLWVPTEMERLLMLQDAVSEMDRCYKDEFYSMVLKSIRFEHFSETTLNLLKDEIGHPKIIHDLIETGFQTQSEIQKRLKFLQHKIGSKLVWNFRVFSKSYLISKPLEITHRTFRVGIEFVEISDVFKIKGLDSREYFYAGSLWRVHMVQRRVQIDGHEYIGVFIHRRCANGVHWSDVRECVEAELRVKMGWGSSLSSSEKVDKICHGKFNPDSWNSYGWPQFIRKTNFEQCRQSDGTLRVTLSILLNI